MYVILPFEKGILFHKYNYDVHFVGHPLIDAISDRHSSQIPKNSEKTYNLSPTNQLLHLLPGSQKTRNHKNAWCHAEFS